MVVANSLSRFFKGNPLVLGNRVQGLLQTALVHFQLGDGPNLQAIEFLGKFQNRLVTPGFHLMQDVAHRLVHLMINAVVPGQKFGQRIIKVTLGSVQSGDLGGHNSNPVWD